MSDMQARKAEWEARYALNQPRIKALQAQINQARDAYEESVAITVGVPRRHLVWGGWDCPSSPTGECFYDERTDPGHDECIFCGDPDERK